MCLVATDSICQGQQIYVEQPLERFIERWVQLPGIGEWTAHYIAMRVLKHPDAFPAADLILRREANPQGEPLSTKAPQALVESWRPWRAYSVIRWRRAATDSIAARKVRKHDADLLRTNAITDWATVSGR